MMYVIHHCLRSIAWSSVTYTYFISCFLSLFNHHSFPFSPLKLIISRPILSLLLSHPKFIHLFCSRYICLGDMTVEPATIEPRLLSLPTEEPFIYYEREKLLYLKTLLKKTKNSTKLWLS